MTEEQKAFVAELRALMEKHQMALVPSYEGKPNAHDIMLVVPLDDFWRKFFGYAVLSLKSN